MTGLLLKASLGIASKLLRAPLVTLVYHRVLDRPDPMYPFDLTADEFDAHMHWVAQTFNVLRVSDAIARLRAGRLPARALCITFDDGYLNSLTRALPVLQRYKLPAAVFVCTSCLDCGIMWNDEITEGLRAASPQRLDLRPFGLREYDLTNDNRSLIAQAIISAAKYLDFNTRAELARRLYTLCDRTITDPMLGLEQIQALHRNGIEIGCHTHTHPILSRIDADAARQDIARSKTLLESAINSSVNFFAYPNGHPLTDFTRVHVDIVRDLGFAAAFTADPGSALPKDDFLQLPRFAPWDHTKWKYLLHLSANYFQRPVLTPNP